MNALREYIYTSILILFFLSSSFLFAETNIPDASSTHETSKSRREVLGSPETSIPAVKTYAQLLSALIRVREETKAEIAQVIRQAKVREAWETGTLIEKHLTENGYVAAYGEQVTAKLALRLGFSRSLLNRMRAFARAYPSGVPVSLLSWNDYILLMRVLDLKKREALAEAAEKENWTYARLALEVRRWKAESRGGVDDSDKLPELTLPTPGIYPWVMMDGKKYYHLGFSAYLEKTRVPEAEIPPGKGAGEENFHTYEAVVTRVVDGDTFRARIQAGFGIVVEQRVRLKRIDAAEIQTPEGARAKALLEKILARDHGHVILQTFGMDQRGRSLANVWVCAARSAASEKMPKSSRAVLEAPVSNDEASAAGARTTGDERQCQPVDQEILDADLAIPMEG